LSTSISRRVILASHSIQSPGLSDASQAMGKHTFGLQFLLGKQSVRTHRLLWSQVEQTIVFPLRVYLQFMRRPES
jgi:hypothetical protein